MAITNLYRTLFNLELLHHYFLDEGDMVYEDQGITDPKVIKNHEANRRKYRLSDFFEIVPTAKTKQQLKNWKATCNIQDDGILVGIKTFPVDPATTPDTASVNPFIPFDDSFVMDFTIKVTDQYFENYTDTVWHKDKLVMISNQTPTAITEPDNEGDPIPVPVEFSLLSKYSTEIEGSFIGVDLSKDIAANELQGKFGLIRIHLQGEAQVPGEPTKLWLVEELDVTKMAATTPSLRIFLKNRQTNWYYYSKEDGSQLFPFKPKHEKLRPLTQNGYVQIAKNGPFKKYPNPDAKLIVLIGSEYYSETIK